MLYGRGTPIPERTKSARQRDWDRAGTSQDEYGKHQTVEPLCSEGGQSWLAGPVCRSFSRSFSFALSLSLSVSRSLSLTLSVKPFRTSAALRGTLALSRSRVTAAERIRHIQDSQSQLLAWAFNHKSLDKFKSFPLRSDAGQSWLSAPD